MYSAANSNFTICKAKYVSDRKQEVQNWLYSARHAQVIFLWHWTPGLLKSHAAQVASSMIAGGCCSNSI